MTRLPDKLVPIELFPLPWSESLPGMVGSFSFQLDGPIRKSMPQEWLGLISSHNTKHGYANQDWQESLQSALLLAQRQGWGILCAKDTPYSEIIVHACKRFHIPFRTIRVNGPATANDPTENREYEQANSCNFGILWIDHASGNTASNATREIQTHDVALVFLANHVFVIELREGGKVATLLTLRLRCPDIPPGSTYLSLPTTHKSKTPSPQCRDWLARGAIGWLNGGASTSSPSEHPATQQTNPASDLASHEGITIQPVLPMRLLGATKRKYLVHCTRPRRGPWPDQSIPQFHDELLQYPWLKQPSVLETLHRILQQKRFIATNNFRRGKTPTVCFSGNEIHELLTMRRFQSHLARWDWEPYGIMIDADWLQQIGAKPVSYIDSGVAKKMSEHELPFCQVVTNVDGPTNWRQEKEWRVAGDIRLCKVPFSKAIVFVASRADARVLQSISRWPIAVVDPEK